MEELEKTKWERSNLRTVVLLNSKHGKKSTKIHSLMLLLLSPPRHYILDFPILEAIAYRNCFSVNTQPQFSTYLQGVVIMGATIFNALSLLHLDLPLISGD